MYRFALCAKRGKWQGDGNKEENPFSPPPSQDIQSHQVIHFPCSVLTFLSLQQQMYDTKRKKLQKKKSQLKFC